MSTNTRTTSGSNWDPEPARSSASAGSTPIEPRYGRSLVMASNESATAKILAPSDEDGVRHKLMADSKLDYDDAKFMLVACSAFVNFLKGKAAQLSKP